MEKKDHAKKVKKPVVKKDKFICKSCGLVLSVDNACSCDPCDLMCCGQNMETMVC